MKRQYENLIITVLTIFSVMFGYIAKTKTWNYPKYEIKSTDPSILEHWKMSLTFALVISVLIVLILKFTHKNIIREHRFIRMTEKAVRFSQRGFIVIFAKIFFTAFIILSATAVFCFSFVDGNKFRAFIHILQQIINASYVLICYEIANTLHKTIFPQERAVILYFIFHFLLVVFCSWIDYAKIFYLNPVNIIWHTSAFAIVYIKVFNNSTAVKQKLMYFTTIVFVQTFIFSLQRITQIISSIFEPSERFLTNWLKYRWDVFQAFVTNAYSTLEDIVLLNLKNYHIIWLGIAFEQWQQILFLLCFALFLIVLILMYCKHKFEPLLSTLILGIIVSNILGIICEINLLYSANFGIMTSKNLFQIIPIICVIYLNDEAV